MGFQLNVQSFIHEHGIDALTERFGIKVKPHPEFETLRHLCYDQIASAPYAGHSVVNECRGLILVANTLEIVAWPFHRFYNDGEVHASEMHWPSARVQSKVDGSLMVLWEHKGGWHVSTKGSPAADGKVHEHEITFRNLFWSTFWAQGWDVAGLDPDLTYIFELSSPLNRVVVRYEECGLTLLGVRSRLTGQEIPASEFPKLNPVQEYPLGSLADVRAAAEALNPIEGEGFVVVDQKFNRIKIKSPRYVAIHHLKDTLTPRGIVEMIKAGEENEVLAYFPKLKNSYDEISAKINALVQEAEANYARLADIQGQKEFAIEAVKTRLPGALFVVRKGQVPTIREAVLRISTDNLIDLIGK